MAEEIALETHGKAPQRIINLLYSHLQLKPTVWRHGWLGKNANAT